jgi:hypothetical protein
VIAAWPISNDFRFESSRALDLAGFDAGPSSPFPGEEGVWSGRQESTTMKEPIRFSTAFCMWLHVGGPLL